MPLDDDILKSALEGIPQNRDTLLQALVARLDDSMVREIAEADYKDDVAEHEAALREICRVLAIDLKLHWHPGEVLELVRWSVPEDPDWGPGGHGIRGHVMRAFCCCVLLHDQRYGAGGTNQSIAPLIQSALELGGEVPGQTLDFINWCLHETDIEPEERVFAVLAVLLLTVSLGQSNRGVERAIVRWLESEYERLRLAEHTCGDAWFWEVTCFNLSHWIWKQLVEQILLSDSTPSSKSLDGEVQAFAHRLLDEYVDKRAKRG